MQRLPVGEFSSIAAVDAESFDFFNMLDVFGYEDSHRALLAVRDWVERGIVHPGFGGKALPEVQPPPPGEPQGVLLAYPEMFRCGVVSTIMKVEGRMTLEGASIYFQEGVQHRFELEKITLSRHRGLGVLHGLIGGVLSISVFEPTFVADRQWHGAGSIHEILLYAIPFQIEIGAPPPFEIKDPLSPDGSGVLQVDMDRATMLLSLNDAPPSFYSAAGPVKRVERYDLNVLGKCVTAITITVARLGEDFDQDVDIRLYVPDSMLESSGPPRAGDMLQATVRLCASLWMANVSHS